MNYKVKGKVQWSFAVLFSVGLGLFWAWKIPTLNWHWLIVAFALACHFFATFIIAFTIIEIVDEVINSKKEIKRLKRQEKDKEKHLLDLFKSINNDFSYEEKHAIRERMVVDEHKQNAIDAILYKFENDEKEIIVRTQNIETYKQQLRLLGYYKKEVEGEK